MSGVVIRLRGRTETAAQEQLSAATRRTEIRVGALRTLLAELRDRQESRLARVQTGYLMDRLGVELRHLDRLREEAERAYEGEAAT